MKIYFFKYRYTEIGFCQVHYVYKTPLGHLIYYCLMEDGGVGLYRCSEDGEADYQVTLKKDAEMVFELPPDEYGQSLHKAFTEGISDQWKVE